MCVFVTVRSIRCPPAWIREKRSSRVWNFSWETWFQFLMRRWSSVFNLPSQSILFLEIRKMCHLRQFLRVKIDVLPICSKVSHNSVLIVFLARKTHCKNAQNLPSHLIMIGCIGSPRNSCIGVMRIIDGRSGSNHSIMSSLASWLMPSMGSKTHITAIDMIDLDMT